MSSGFQKLNPAAEEYSRTHHAEAFCCSCIDFRFVDYTSTENMRKYDHKFDQFAMAGSELYVVQSGKPSFRDVFFQNVEIAIQLHHIKTIVMYSHADCGAYAEYYGTLTGAMERYIHVQNLTALRDILKERYPKLGFKGYYQYLDGHLELVV